MSYTGDEQDESSSESGSDNESVDDSNENQNSGVLGMSFIWSVVVIYFHMKLCKNLLDSNKDCYVRYLL